jgi:diacylglycerol kinase (ATP)
MKGQPFLARLGFALHGIYLAFRREKSVRLQSLAAVGVLAVLSATSAPPLWWALGIVATALVIVAEFANAALESLADRLHPERHPEIKAAKDIAAGAVLVASVAALAVAVAFCFALGLV